MYGQTKPLYDVQRKLTYNRHLQRLDQISKERSKRVSPNFTTEMHSIRHKASYYHTIEHASALNHQNQKIIDSLMKIAKRKSTSVTQQPSMLYFHNSRRKEHEKEIARSNYILADRILRKQSDFDPISIRRHIDSYEQMKKRMERNRNASLPQLEELSRAGSSNKSRSGSRARIIEIGGK